MSPALKQEFVGSRQYVSCSKFELHLATLWQQPPGMASRASLFFQYQTLLFQLVSLELLCKPHQTLLDPAPPRILFAREEVPTYQTGWFRELVELIWGKNQMYGVNIEI